MKHNRVARAREIAGGIATKSRGMVKRMNDLLTEAFQAFYRQMDRRAIQDLSARAQQSRPISDEQAVERYCRSLRERRRILNGTKLEF